MSATDIELLFGDLDAYLAQANQLLAKGDMETLAELAPQVDQLIERLSKLPAADSQEYAEEIAHLKNGLGTLVGSMNKTKTEMSAVINSVGKHHKAARAYLTTPES